MNKRVPSLRLLAGTAIAGTMCFGLVACNEEDMFSGQPLTVAQAAQANSELNPAGGPYRDAVGVRRVHQAVWERFNLLGTTDRAGNDFEVNLIFDDRRVIVDDPNRYVTFNPGTALANFPTPQCMSRNFELNTGGGNCCSTYYLLTSCEQGSFAARLGSDKQSTMGAPEQLNNNTWGIPIDDPGFFSYAPMAPAGAAPFRLSMNESPKLKRFVVFENNQWRMDRPGEFSSVYEKLARDSANSNMMPTTKAIAVAYYSSMAGANADGVKRDLGRNLPQPQAAYAETVYADIQRNIGAFNPVRNIPIGAH